MLPLRSWRWRQLKRAVAAVPAATSSALTSVRPAGWERQRVMGAEGPLRLQSEWLRLHCRCHGCGGSQLLAVETLILLLQRPLAGEFGLRACARGPSERHGRGKTDGGRRQTAPTSASQSECSPQERLEMHLRAASKHGRARLRRPVGPRTLSTRALEVAQARATLRVPARAKRKAGHIRQQQRCGAAAAPQGALSIVWRHRQCCRSNAASCALRCQDGMAEPRK